MTARQQWSLVGGIVAVLAIALFAASRLLGDQLYPVSVGSIAPAFAAKTVDAAPVTKTLADYKGRVVLLNIWGTFCLPCRDEMPAIEKLHQAMASQGLEVVAVSMDDPGFEDKIRAFVKEFGLTFQILYDPSGKITNDYQTTGVPETFIIARDGVIRKKVIGASDWNSATNRALIAQLLAEPGK
ncbi:MAG TPA: TlpA disulfide reductase family protein [Gemmatimonadaceae bacterium]|jgi:peroxiredoxin|nr:TlpA disulfide reductase family protein [Gemmatimonadaceae bacterium]